MSNRARIPWVIGAAASVLLIGGLVVFLSGPDVASFGWYAYSPLTDSASAQGFGGAVVWSRRQLAGAGLVVLGLVLAVGTAGYLLGHRNRSTG